jgi:hypothetical protein
MVKKSLGLRAQIAPGSVAAPAEYARFEAGAAPCQPQSPITKPIDRDFFFNTA